MASPGTHGGLSYNRERWDWASRDAHRYWITGTDSEDHYDRSGWSDVLRLLAVCPGYRDLSVLEWGSGSGRMTQYLCYLFRQVRAVDIAPGMLQLLEARRLPDTSVHLTDGAGLPPGLTADVVCSYICWMHNRKEDLTAIFHSCRGALGPGGRLLFQLPVYDVPRDPEGFSDLACWTPGELTDLAARTGFEVVSLVASPGAFSFEAIGPNHFGFHEFRTRG